MNYVSRNKDLIKKYEMEGWRLSDATKSRRRSLKKEVERHLRLSKETLNYLEQGKSSIYHQLQTIVMESGRIDSWLRMDLDRRGMNKIIQMDRKKSS